MNGHNHISEIKRQLKLAEIKELLKNNGEQYILYCPSCKQPTEHKRCVTHWCVNYGK